MNMLKVLPLRLNQNFDPFTMGPVEGSLKRDFLDFYVTMPFGVRNFGSLRIF